MTLTFYEIFPYIFSLGTLLLGYFLGLKSQKTQALREYITDTVKTKYPDLSSEIKINLNILDIFLEYPLEQFNFPYLDQFYSDGLNEFMKKHHEDLFLSINYLKQEITPKFYELHQITGESIKRIFDIWTEKFTTALPAEQNKTIFRITHDLIRTINKNNVFQDLLNDRKDTIKEKIQNCLDENTSLIYRATAKNRSCLLYTSPSPRDRS